MILGIADNNVLLTKRFGKENYVIEVLKRFSLEYKNLLFSHFTNILS